MLSMYQYYIKHLYALFHLLSHFIILILHMRKQVQGG